MSTEIKPDHGAFRFGPGLFIFASAAAAMGLGRLWQLPQQVAEYGGGTFLVLYLVCLLVVGVPLLMVGALLGRQGGADIAGALARGGEQSKTTRRWAWAGYPALLCAWLLLAVSAMPAGWALQGVWASLHGAFLAMTPDQALAQFQSGAAQTSWSLALSAMFLAPVALVLAFGGKLLRAVLWVLAPLSFLLLLVLVGCVVSTQEFTPSLALHFHAFSLSAVADALGLAVLTLGLGAAGTVVVGAALPAERGRTPLSLAPPALAVAVVMVLATWLMLVVLPLTAATSVLFTLVVTSSWCAVLVLAEAVLCWLVRLGVGRKLAAPLVLLSVWLLAAGLMVLSGSGAGIAGVVADLVRMVLLPLAVLLLAVFTDWVMKETRARKGLAMKGFVLYLGWRAAVRIVVPLAMLLLLVLAVPGVGTP